MISELFDTVISVLTLVMSVLPSSFVHGWLDKFSGVKYLSYVNYFIPFNTMLNIGSTWLACCGAYLVYHYIQSVYKDVRS